jgi:glutathione S-transferase
MRVSPFVRKVLVFAAEKGIELEAKPAFRGSDDPEWLVASPFRKMPALVDGDFALADSSAIVAYLEALHPEPGLIPTEPRARGRTIWFDEFADTILFGTGVKIFFNRVVAPILGEPCDEAAAAAAETDEMPGILDYLESAIPASGFLVESRLTLADITVVSPLVNIGYCSKVLDPARWPKTSAYVAAITARPAFAAVLEAERAQLAKQQARAKG